MSAYDVAILDWGIGGLSVYQKFIAKNPQARVLYFSDSGFQPYGTLRAQEMSARLFTILEFLHQKFRVNHFIIACNAASTALQKLQPKLQKTDFFVTGMIDPMIVWLRQAPQRKIVNRKIGFIGGRRTVRSKIFQNQCGITGRIAQPLSALIEAGHLKGSRLDRQLAQILKPLRSYNFLILACTHYPAISTVIQQHLQNTVLIDPADIVVSHFCREFFPNRIKSVHKATFVTTGNMNKSRQAAKLAFQVHANFQKLNIR